MHPLWYRNAIIYQADVARFLDSDGDGWGDLRGATARLEHIRDLGATCVWLLPFYRSAGRDGGYDVVDHLAVDPRFGDIADVTRLFEKAEALGLRIIVDLVGQHTSTDHPWFQEARRDRHSPYRDYYVWADEPHETGVEPVFPTVEDSVWTWDDEAGQFYRHTFYDHEPDLEMGNPRVRNELERVMGYWLRLGVSGFRVDAAPYMTERARAADPRADGLWLIEDMRRFVGNHHPEAILIGEVDVEAHEYDDYLGADTRFTMLLDFWRNNHTFLALARGKSEPLIRAMDELPLMTGSGTLATFLRNHDELDLERLTEDERAEVMAAFAPDPEMRIYGRGVRRRLAPMLDGEIGRIAMAHALQLSLPGTPVVLYGDEIGIGEDLSRPERTSVRTPMQWSDALNGGFSTADSAELVSSAVRDGPFGYKSVNVADQVGRPDSLLSRVRDLIRSRVGATEIGDGSARLLDVGREEVLCLRHDVDGRSLITAVNLSDHAVDCVLPERHADDIVDLVDIVADQGYPPAQGRPPRFRLDRYGYRWLRPRDQI